MDRQPWHEAWHDALYGPSGFYRRCSPAEHFATSAQGIPHAGPLLACAVASVTARHGLRQVVDVGAGRGELLRELATEAPELDLLGVDVVERPDDLPDHISWMRSPGGRGLPDALDRLRGTLVIAHEWLDDVPCPVAAYDGRSWRVVLVNRAGEERLGDELDAEQSVWRERHGRRDASDGDRIEIGTTRDAAYADLCERIRDGVVVAVDYGHRSGEAPPGGTLTGYRHGSRCEPVPDGSCDITAHVCVDSLGADELITQRDLLGGLDIAPPNPPVTLARTDPPAYLEALAQRSAWAALREPGGLGDFWWAITRR